MRIGMVAILLVLISFSAQAEIIEIVNGNGQTGSVGVSLGAPLSVIVRPDSGFGYRNNYPVRFAIRGEPAMATGTSLSTTSTTTNGTGVASTTLTLGSKPGTYTVRATANGSSVDFTATAYEGTPPEPDDEAETTEETSNDQTSNQQQSSDGDTQQQTTQQTTQQQTQRPSDLTPRCTYYTCNDAEIVAERNRLAAAGDECAALYADASMTYQDRLEHPLQSRCPWRDALITDGERITYFQTQDRLSKGNDCDPWKDQCGLIKGWSFSSDCPKDGDTVTYSVICRYGGKGWSGSTANIRVEDDGGETCPTSGGGTVTIGESGKAGKSFTLNGTGRCKWSYDLYRPDGVQLGSGSYATYIYKKTNTDCSAETDAGAAPAVVRLDGKPVMINGKARVTTSWGSLKKRY